MALTIRLVLYEIFKLWGGLKTRETDGDMESSNAWKVADPIRVLVGPFTRARAKKFKEVNEGDDNHFSREVNSFFGSLTNYSNLSESSVEFKTDLSVKPSILDCGVFDIPRFLLRYKQRVAVISIRI
ncbi:hypothetical protein TIFTF001_028477 [Ficus carica]|uniref:Uncharacterized protein n=1 Tax=Ficus carica TaxID=3494 RepID=A0AA88DQH6_FICCA|nr:hypothetical protein TIFTF001_028477 [Ficus carica]